jgi:hypothetical protein
LTDSQTGIESCEVVTTESFAGSTPLCERRYLIPRYTLAQARVGNHDVHHTNKSAKTSRLATQSRGNPCKADLRRLGLQSAEADLVAVAAISNRRNLKAEWPCSGRARSGVPVVALSERLYAKCRRRSDAAEERP